MCEYFDRNPSSWNIIDFLNRCPLEPFSQKIDCYIKSLDAIVASGQVIKWRDWGPTWSPAIQGYLPSHETVPIQHWTHKGTGGLLGPPDARGSHPDRQKAREWEAKRARGYIQIHQPVKGKIGTVIGNISGNADVKAYISKKSVIHGANDEQDSKRTKIHHFFPVLNAAMQTQADSDGAAIPKDDALNEQVLLQEDPYSSVDCRLMINGVCIRSAMENWRKSSKHVDEIHKQDLMYYNIIDTTPSSATGARQLFNDSWNDISSAVEGLLGSRSHAIPLASNSGSSADQDMENDGRADDIKQYLTSILKNVNTAEKLCDAIKRERERLRTNGNLKWKKRSLALLKIFRDQFPHRRNCLREQQTEYNYIINFISRVFNLLLKDKPFLKCSWGETTLRSSAALLNQSLKDDERRHPGNKIDAILSLLELDLEFCTLEVSGPPSHVDHTHYVGDRNKTAKMLKIILNFIKRNFSGDFELFRRIKVYGMQVYEKDFPCPTMSFLFFKELPKFASNLWLMQEMIVSSTERILAYVTNTIAESSSDDSKIDKTKVSPTEKKDK
ncbi:203_t:CDS:10, partial [Ambispora leptoticha]